MTGLTSGRLTIRRIITVAFLAGMWSALWGEISVGNTLVGVVLGVAATTSRILPPLDGAIRIWPLAVFVYRVFIDLVAATGSVAWAIVNGDGHTDEAYVTFVMPLEVHSHLLILVVAVTVTPGTAVVDADGDTNEITLHLLDRRWARETEAHVRELAALLCRALPAGPAMASTRSENLEAAEDEAPMSNAADMNGEA